MVLDQRKEQLLVEIVKRYIQTAEPVSSKLISASGFFGVSSATVRNDMNELEEAGYLAQPHVSSGRVPTDRAYRFFVDRIVASQLREPGEPLKRKIYQTISRAGDDPREVNRAVGQLISDLLDQLVITAIRGSEDFFKTGLSHLLEFPEFREFERVFRLTSFFDQFDELFQSLEDEFFGQVASDLNVFIGRENPVKGASDETLITATYRLPRRHSGSLTLIGPTRMDYGKNISIIKYAVGELNRLF